MSAVGNFGLPAQWPAWARNSGNWPLAAGLVLSVLLMGLAVGVIARMLERTRWIAWVGLAIVLFVSLRMTLDASREVVVAI